jgi:hypothetical protein
MYCITINADGQEVSRTPKPKRWSPRNGFQKKADGNFYKVLGDPRCISDQEIKKALLEKKRLAEEAEERKKMRPLLPSPMCRSNDDKLVLLPAPQRKISLDSLKKGLRYRSACLMGAT